MCVFKQLAPDQVAADVTQSCQSSEKLTQLLRVPDVAGSSAGRGSVPSYPAIESAVRALASVVGYAVWLRTPNGPAASLDGIDAAAGQLQRLSYCERLEAKQRLFGAGQAGEVGPDDAVEDVLAQRGKCLGQGMHLDGRAPGGHAQAQHRVSEQRDAQHMVQVGMADQDVVDGGQRVQRQVAHAGAGVDEDIVVEQEGGGLVAGGDGAGAAQDADVHAVRGLDSGVSHQARLNQQCTQPPAGRDGRITGLGVALT